MIKSIVIYKNPLLRKKSKAVKTLNKTTKQLIKDMLETMYQSNGVGLAAVQVGELTRIIVIDISEKQDSPIVIINPKIKNKHGDKKGVEGCLSVPGFEGEVSRYTNITVAGKNEKFADIEFTATDFLAVVIQHEIDHLDGVLYIDKVKAGTLTPVKQL